MTEKQWLAATNLKQPLKSLRSGSERRRRLFALACCARVLPLVNDVRAAEVLATIERYADGLADSQELAEAESTAFALFDEARGDEEDTNLPAAALAADAIVGAANGGVTGEDLAEYASREAAGAVAASVPRGKQTAARGSETAAQLAVLRDIFGNPFRPVAVDPAWLTATVVALATGVYDERAFDRLPILAAALQDAGCDSDDLLNHLRDPNATHVCGCWALDLVLGKS